MSHTFENMINKVRLIKCVIKKNWLTEMLLNVSKLYQVYAQFKNNKNS